MFIIGNGCFLALRRGETKAIVIGGNNGRSSEKIHITKVKVTWSGTTAYISEDKTVEFGVDGKTSIQSYSIPGWDAAWIEYIYIMF